MIATFNPDLADDGEVNDADLTLQELIDKYMPLAPEHTYFDLVFGAVVGVWNPYMQRARNYDCQSAFFAFGLDLSNYYLMTDPYWFNGFDDTNSLIWFSATTLNQLWSAFELVDTCAGQLTYSEANPWVSKMWTVLLPQKAGFDAAHDVAYFLFTAWYAYQAIYAANDTQDYWFVMARSGMAALSRFVMLVDKWGNGTLANPKNPWLRYA